MLEDAWGASRREWITFWLGTVSYCTCNISRAGIGDDVGLCNGTRVESGLMEEEEGMRGAKLRWNGAIEWMDGSGKLE